MFFSLNVSSVEDFKKTNQNLLCLVLETGKSKIKVPDWNGTSDFWYIDSAQPIEPHWLGSCLFLCGTNPIYEGSTSDLMTSQRFHFQVSSHWQSRLLLTNINVRSLVIGQIGSNSQIGRVGIST